MKRYELEAMSKEDLVEHGKAMGIEILPEEKKGVMVDKILGEHVEKPEIKQESSGIKKQPDKQPPPMDRLYDLNGKPIIGRAYKVKIFSTESDKSDVPLVVNGYNCIVKRNVEVTLSEPFVEVLRNATIETIVQDPDTGVRTPQTIQVYPHQATPI
jgi:hypothetical protein